MELLKPNEIIKFFQSHKGIELNILPKVVQFGAVGYKSKIRSNIIPRQNPTELIKLMHFLETIDTKRYLEIGIEFGGTLMLLDAFLRTSNDKYIQSIGLDLRLNLNDPNITNITNTHRKRKSILPLDIKSVEAFQIYNKQNPTCKFIHTHSDDYIITDDFDFVFIDSNQKVRHLTNTFNQFKDHSRYIGFHDIKDGRYGTGTLFKTLSEEYESFDLSEKGTSPGIGIIQLTV